jgi:hypothetical protein
MRLTLVARAKQIHRWAPFGRRRYPSAYFLCGPGVLLRTASLFDHARKKFLRDSDFFFA